MKIGILGLWHLGSVTAACCAQHFDVIGFDPSADTVKSLQQGRAPIAEPGLDDLMQAGLRAGRLTFTHDRQNLCDGIDVLWVTFDTPVDDDDVADTELVLEEIRRCLPLLPKATLVLLSSQLPVGSCRQLEQEFHGHGFRFACSPENLRLGRALEIFNNPDRVIVGCRDGRSRLDLAQLFEPFGGRIEWMNTESAEMTKHAINAFLALSITYMNELSLLCERTGADAREVERGLKSESRIGPKAYLSPGAAFAGGTLARDVMTCIGLGEAFDENLRVLPAIKQSNDLHRAWPVRAVVQRVSPQHGHVALLGLTYKPGTNTLRRSSAVTWARELHKRGYAVRAFDPAITSLPPDDDFITLAPNIESLMADAAALVVCTAWPEFLDGDWPALIASMKHPLLLDQANFLAANINASADVEYVTVGAPR